MNALLNPASLLNVEIEQIRLVAELIESEREALIHNRLPPSLEAEAQAIDVIATAKRLTEKRHDIMRQAGFSTDPEGTLAWVRTDPAPEAAAAAWNTLCALATQVQELNRVNGVLIERRVRTVNEQLSALKCDRTGGQTYGPDGKTRSGRGLRPTVES